MPPRDLPKTIEKAIDTLCAEGDAHAEADDFEEAIDCYQRALAQVPEPKRDFEAATWVLAALGDALFQDDQFDRARDTFAEALQGAEGAGNPFLHLRLGQAAFELQDLDGATKELQHAWALAGREVFDDEHPKYLDFLRSRVKL
jgi:tetratricopeptide (TPR) repeat protein